MSHDTAHPDPRPDPTDPTRGESPEMEAAACWAALAPLLSGRAWCRESRDATPRRRGGYLARWQRLITDRLPAVPAAVPIYNTTDGTGRLLVIDLDVGRSGPAAVTRDAAAVADLVRAAGGRTFSDESPTGGVHVYVPLTVPVSFHQARDMALALARRLPSMDPSPNRNLLAGLIRPPGARHRTGGYQRLQGPLSDAVAVAAAGNPPAVWQQLTAALSAELADVHTAAANPPATADTDTGSDGAPHRQRRGGPRDLTADYTAIARTGTWPDGRYKSPSEARMAVITAAAWAGHTLTDVLRRLHNGAWPGLASLYARYHPGARTAAVRADWIKAHHLITAHAAAPAGPTKNHSPNPVRQSPTSELSSHGGDLPTRQISNDLSVAAEYRWIRTWWNALQIAETQRYQATSTGLSRRIVLRAMGEAAMKTGSRVIEFGTRSLAVATGLDHTTVAAHLRALTAEDDPLIDQLANERGLRADLYTLRIPDEYQRRADRRPWRPGRLHALRPVFHHLGRPAAVVYEALEARRDDPADSFDLAGTGLSRTTIWDTLRLLAAHGLAERGSAGWQITTASLTQLAEQLGITEAIAAIVARHREERARYRAALGIPTRTHLAIVADPDQPPPTPQPHPPPPMPGEAETALELLHRVLGARIIHTSGPESQTA